MKNEVAALLLNKYGKKNPPMVKSGDTVRVHQKIKEGDKERVQIFEGLVISTKHGSGLDGTFTVRKIATGNVGVERTYPVHSPNVLKVERIKNAEVSRSKLYYMRDRKGKSARFKSESRDIFMWDEAAAVAALAAQAAEAEIATAELLAEQSKEEVSDQVVVTSEGTVEMEALESAQETTEDEAAEVEKAVEVAAAEQEEEVK